MKNLIIEASGKTQNIVLDRSKAHFEISGNSSPENADEFYQPAVNWLKAYFEDPLPETTFIFKFDFFNSSSSRAILAILSELEDLDNITVIWYYKDSDNDMEEAGEEFAELVDIPFEFESF